MTATKSKNTNHVEKLTFFGEHTLVTPPPRPGFKEALRKKVKAHYLEVSENESNENPLFSPFAKYAGIFFSLLFTLLISIGGITFYYKNLPNHTVTANQRVSASLSYIEGTVEVARDGDWLKLENSSELYEGESVRLSADARAIISFKDRADIRLSADSEVKLSSLKDKHIIVDNNAGEVYARVIPNSESVFEVRIDNVSYESLGTAFKTINTSTKQGVEVYHSKVKIKQKDSDNEVIVEQGNQYFVKNEEDKSAENKIVPVQADQLAQDSFVQWNKSQDQETVDNVALGILIETADIAPTVNLSLSQDSNGILLNWTKENLPESYTYKVLTGDTENLTLNNLNATIEDKSAEAYIIQPSTDIKQLFAKVCVYSDDKCVAFSNIASIELDPNVLGIKDEVLVKSIRLVKDDTLGAVILRWYIEPNNIQGVEGFRLEYDKLNPKTGKITEKEVVIDNAYDRKYIIYTPDFEVNSYIKICILQSSECIVQSNIVIIEKEATDIVEEKPMEQTSIEQPEQEQVTEE
ncbi:FecR domain-containing protein [Candidatus Dojkabacteria bacterium]|uniref:FecR domain-containing protein n=1 Tax=Candidatus Dojkabacteria bacterium TaxID=2099670 RepID=A0A955IAA7_9BACT|nr:FecR domain-containing protein [Candidatus Dojkabacteria bacterium]